MKEKEVWKFWCESKLPKTHKRYVKYEVSNLGNVKRNGMPYECRLDKNGYKGFGHCCNLHRVVAELFVPNPNNYNEVDHINGDRLDNKAINLQWCTHKQNLNNPITRKRRSESMKGNQHAKGKTPSEEIRRKRSESMKGNQNAKGKTRSEESRKRMSENHANVSGKNNPMYGKPGPNKGKHRVYHDDGTYHYEKNI